MLVISLGGRNKIYVSLGEYTIVDYIALQKMDHHGLWQRLSLRRFHDHTISSSYRRDQARGTFKAHTHIRSKTMLATFM